MLFYFGRRSSFSFYQQLVRPHSGVGTIDGDSGLTGFVVDQPLFRASADLNLPLAAIIFRLLIVWALQEVGPIGFAKGIVCAEGETTGL